MSSEADKSSPGGEVAGVATGTTPMLNRNGEGFVEGTTGATPPSSSSKGRKRVRFDEAPPAVRERSPEGEVQPDDTQEVETISLDIDEVCGTKKRRGADAVRTRLPGEDEDDLDETCFQRADQGAIKDFNPVVAAKRRAALREEQKRRNAMMDVSIVPADIAEAEEEYDDEDQERYVTGDIPIEPFNLKHERETGYFDAFGNYIEYRLDADARDAWLDSLSDTKLLRKPQATSSSLVSEVEQELDKEDIVLYKRRMMALLEPGENAFAALRRLGARPTPPPPKQKHQPQETLGTTAARQRQRKQQRAQQQQQQQQQQPREGPSQGPMDGTMDVQGPAASAPSAGPSSSSEAPASASVSGPTSSSEAPSSSSAAAAAPTEPPAHAVRSADQAASAPVPAAAASTSSQAVAEGSSSGAASVGGGRDDVRNSREGHGSSGTSSGAGRGHRGRGEAVGGGRGSGGMRGPSMENSAEFDKLTEYADLLLGYGELGIYSKTKEQLEKELAGPGSSAQQQQQQQQQEQQQQEQEQGQGLQRPDTEEGGDGSRLVEALLSAATPAGQQTEGQGPSEGVTAAAVPEGASSHEEDDRDMFGESFEVKEGKAYSPSTAAAPDARAVQSTGNATPDARPVRDHSTAEVAPDSGGEAAQPQAHADQELLQQLDGLEAQPAAAAVSVGQQQQQSAQDDAGSAEGAVQQQQQQQQQHWMVNGGFELDPGSGMFYSSNLGLWYNSQTALYMDAQTGAWYRVNETGSYEAAPEAGQGFGCQEEGVQV